MMLLHLPLIFTGGPSHLNMYMDWLVWVSSMEMFGLFLKYSTTHFFPSSSSFGGLLLCVGRPKGLAGTAGFSPLEGTVPAARSAGFLCVFSASVPFFSPLV